MSQAEHIKNEIERTRSELTDTIQAIERKFSPNRLMDEAMQSMRNVNLNQSRVVDMMRENPIPLTLVGLGLSWLVLSSLRGSPALGGEVNEEDYGEGGVQGVLHSGLEEAREWAGYGAGGGGNGSQGLGDLTEGMHGKATDMARNMRDSARDLTGQAQTQARQVSRNVGRLATNMRRSASQWAGRSSDMFQDRPLTVGLLAVVAGFALGAALPRTRREAEFLGDTGDEFWQTARDTGRDALSRAGRVAQRAAEAVGEGGSGTVQRTREAIKDEVRRQNLGGEGNAATAH